MAAKSRKDIEEEVTLAFAEAIEAGGTLPWRKGWSVDGVLPCNFQSKRPYRGFNSLWLGLVQQARGYETPYWTTYNAALKSLGWDGEGGREGANAWRAANPGMGVRKGEKSSIAILWKWLVVEDKATGKDKRVPMLRTFPIFNLDQVDGLEAPAVDRVEREPSGFLPWIQEQYADGPRFDQMLSDSAYYSPMTDSIVVPLSSQFESEAAEAETVAHEFIHSTGHPSRLGRIELGWVERQDYAFEELVAEIGAAMLMQHYGIDPNVPMMAGYVQSWLRALKNDHSLIIKAAQQAQKGVDRITGYVFAEESLEVAA